MKEMKVQYRITGRLAKDPEDKRFVVELPRNLKSLEDAKRKVKEIEAREQNKIKHGASYEQAGPFGVMVKHYDGYEIVDIRIETREVTPWKSM